MDEVLERLSELDTTKACGPDKIPARLLKEGSEQIAPSLGADPHRFPPFYGNR